MIPFDVTERLEKIDLHASRARALVALLASHFTTTDRTHAIDDAQMTDLLELVEDQLEQVSAQARVHPIAKVA